MEARWARPGEEQALIVALLRNGLETIDAQHEFATTNGLIGSRLLGQLSNAEFLASLIAHNGCFQCCSISPVLCQARQYGVITGIGLAVVMDVAQSDIAALKGPADDLAQVPAPPARIHDTRNDGAQVVIIHFWHINAVVAALLLDEVACVGI